MNSRLFRYFICIALLVTAAPPTSERMPRGPSTVHSKAPAQGQKRVRSVLQSSRVIPLLTATDLDRAKTFYEGKLGLKLVREERHVLVFDADGVMIRVSRAASVSTTPHAVLAWDVRDIRQAASELKARGVVFDHFPDSEQNDPAVWTTPDKTKVAWFKDPDGNVLSIVQFP